MIKATLHLMVGLPCAGKTTRQRARALGVGFRIHFMDTPLTEIKQRLQERNQANGNDTFRIAYTDILGWAEHFQPPSEDELADWF